MRLSKFRMSDKEEQIGLKWTDRNSDAFNLEEMVRGLSPLPISYDVDCTQGLKWSEYTYTEYIGGILLKTQNIETNCRILKEAAQIPAKKDHMKTVQKYCEDKYVLESIDDMKFEKVGFMTGHNMFDLVSSEIVGRIAFENDDFKLKLHPLTNDEYASKVAKIIGWDKVLPMSLSGVSLLKGCKVAYLSTATELCTMAVALDKEIVNISNFFNEAGGAYYSINTLLFKSSNPKETLNNILDCPFSGVILPDFSEEEKIFRINEYFKKSLEHRSFLKPISSKNNLKKIPA